MRLCLLFLPTLLLGAEAGHAADWPFAGPLPDQPVAVAPLRYEPVGAGTKSYRPVEPMPWGDVNRRVEPGGEKKQDKDGKH